MRVLSVISLFLDLIPLHPYEQTDVVVQHRCNDSEDYLAYASFFRHIFLPQSLELD